MACSVSGVAHQHRVSAAPHGMMMMRAPHEMMTRAAPPPPPPEPELDASDFDWIGDLGQGGFAKAFSPPTIFVWIRHCAKVIKVRHRHTGEVFALKEAFNPCHDADAEEAEVLRRAAWGPSPHIVRCYALLPAGHDGGPASLLEFMDAGSLRDVLRRRGWRGFPEPALAEAASRCLLGLAQLHSRGVAHLDVKPDNFLADARGDVKINDFNASRVVAGRGAGESVLVETTMGTAAYFSPERFEPRARADSRGAMAADVWGLGLTVLEHFLGRRPVVPQVEVPKAEDWKQVICNREAPAVPEDAEASAELHGFVAACLHKDPARRARVPHLLRHPFVTQRDVEASSRALHQLYRGEPVGDVKVGRRQASMQLQSAD
ncbi:hypothetical protein EJB05_05109, partial [Eragrostis curvula]